MFFILREGVRDRVRNGLIYVGDEVLSARLKSFDIVD